MTVGEEKGSSGNVTPIPARERSGAVAIGDHQLERLVNSFEVSARRWELVVYPALFMFIILASYGFYLIYNLTHDVGQLAKNVASLTTSVESMAGNLNSMTEDMRQVSQQMGRVNATMGTVSDKMNALEPMRESMASMDQSTRYMSGSVERMGHHVGSLNYNVGRPMGAMSSFMPW